MRIAFLDEAGISNPQEEPYTVVAGVIVHADIDWHPLEDRLAYLSNLASRGEGGAVLHTTDIYSGKRRFHHSRGWTAKQRFELLDLIAEIPGKLNLPIVYGFYSRERAKENVGPGTIQDPAQLAHMMAAVLCTLQVERAMRMIEGREICSIVMENTAQSRKVLKESQQFFRNPPSDYVDDSNKGWMPLTRIRGTPQFEDKEDASLLQMADFCAFIIKRQLMRAPKIERFFGPLRPHIGFGYTKEGPNHPLCDPWNPSPEQRF